MTKEIVQEMLLILSAEFGVKPPKLSWRQMRSGLYHTRIQTISMGPRKDWEHVVLHEFAHHLDHCRNKPRKSVIKQYSNWTRTRETYHDVPFRFCLLKVAQAWYGDAAKYPWDREYASVKKWWAWRGERLGQA